MTIPARVRNYIVEHHAMFDVFEHPLTMNSAQTAHAVHIPPERLAKSVILEDDDGYLMAVLPANGRVHLGELSRQTGRKLRLATETEIARIFDDCEPGAVPPVGPAYGLQTMIEESLLEQPDVYFEAGDHTEVIHMSAEQFVGLMAGVPHMHFVTSH
ncbi:MAG TPA: YbaK/EbsC family protein [Burkholderiales bacterium]|nr:YbaK/EbsC family protein [Burkholderiales bacterium]